MNEVKNPILDSLFGPPPLPPEPSEQLVALATQANCEVQLHSNLHCTLHFRDTFLKQRTLRSADALPEQLEREPKSDLADRIMELSGVTSVSLSKHCIEIVIAVRFTLEEVVAEILLEVEQWRFANGNN